MRKQASESIANIRRRPPQAAQRPGPEGPGDGQAASVSAAKTPTAEPVSEVFWPFGTKARAWRLLFFAKRIGSVSCKRSRRDRQSGSARKGRRRHARLGERGVWPKKCPQGTFLGHGLPEQAVSPGSSRGLDARGLRIPVHLNEQVGEQVSEQVKKMNEYKS